MCEGRAWGLGLELRGRGAGTPFTCSASDSTFERKIMATPHDSDSLPLRCPSDSKSSHGTAVNTPAPSPDIESPPQPPRCSMQPSACSAREITSWRRRPFWSARKPTPHASRSPTSDGGPGRGPSSPALLGCLQDCWPNACDPSKTADGIAALAWCVDCLRSGARKAYAWGASASRTGTIAHCGLIPTIRSSSGTLPVRTHAWTTTPGATSLLARVESRTAGREAKGWLKDDVL